MFSQNSLSVVLIMSFANAFLSSIEIFEISVELSDGNWGSLGLGRAEETLNCSLSSCVQGKI